MANRKMRRFRRWRDRIKCECGAEIYLFPDLKAMSEAIDVHIALHMGEGVKGLAFKTVEADRLRDALIIQVLRVAGESEDEQTHE